jgi:hypothetical protein
MMEEIKIDLDENTLNTLIDFARSKIVNDKQALINYGVNYALKEIINGAVDLDTDNKCKKEASPVKSYKQLMEKSDIEVGDYVIVVQKISCRKEGWNLTWNDNMDRTLGKIYRVKDKIDSRGIFLDNGYWYHPDSLTLYHSNRWFPSGTKS